LFIAEGAKVIRRALRAGLRPRAVLTEPKWYEELADDLPGNIEVLLATPAVLRSTTGYRVHRGALASFARPAPAAPASMLARARFVVVLVDLVDHTNVGALFRTAAALGADAVLVSPGCADPLYRRSVKVSMGAVLSVPWTRCGADPLADLSGLQTVALTPAPDSLDLDEAAASWPDDRSGRALLLGTEGAGLPAALLERAEMRVRIPMARAIDSLNVAAAGAIAMHALRPRS
jgi:tRNA G18 (ribose-2'-O)-methylase SpoU